MKFHTDFSAHQIFMVSSLNHHISILKLTVHEAYLDFLETEKIPTHFRPDPPIPADQGWCSPRLERTQWYDLFNVDERVQAFRALWGAMAYLSREIERPTAGGADGADDEVAS